VESTGSTTVAVIINARAVMAIVAQIMVVIALRAWNLTSKAVYYQKDIL
jgi:hypothetical protein